MIEISESLANKLRKGGCVGMFYEDTGAIVGHNELIVVSRINRKQYIAHISEFECKGCFIKIKEDK